LVENNEFNGVGADYFIKQNIDHLFSQSNKIDTIILGCTHYPLLIEKIKKHLPPNITLVSQGEIVSGKLSEYLTRHPEIEQQCSKGNNIEFFTTDSAENFDAAASIFFGEAVHSKHLSL
jgi:glutamate racemase